MSMKEVVLHALKPVIDPEIGVSIVDLGLIYDVGFGNDDSVTVKMTLTTPACPYGPELIDMTREAVLRLDGVEDVEVMVVWDPPWDPKEMASDYAKDILGIW